MHDMASGMGYGHWASPSFGSHADHSATNHAEHGEAMARGMLRRFVVSLLLTLLIILFSPIGASLDFKRACR